MKKTAREQWDALPDLATPEERKWIDEWARGRYEQPWRYKILHRQPEQPFKCLYVMLQWGDNGRRLTRTLYRGVMTVDLKFIQTEVRRNRREAARNRRREAEHQVGAYI